MPDTKTLPATVNVKAAQEGADDGIVEALVATYDVDSSGDRILPGAFTKSLAQWSERNKRIPFIWSHLHNDIDAYIGEVLEAKETDDGLWVKAQIDMDDPKSAKVFRAIKGDRVDNYSFAYEVLDAEDDTEGDGDRLLKELHLFEVGPVLIGMNQNTRTLVAKAAGDMTSRPSGEGKAGRVLSAKNEADLRTAADLIKGVLSQLGEASTTSQEKTSDADPATDKEPPPGVTAKEPSRATPVTTLAAHLQLLKMKGERHASDSDSV
jgi:uncharacterized protein